MPRVCREKAQKQSPYGPADQTYNLIPYILFSFPSSTDPAPLPPPVTAAVWKYKAAYRIKDEPIGHWSNSN